jgi:CHAT domain-containing protein
LKQMDNPLLRSGIVLAGANTIGDKDKTMKVEDGWVTAEEIALVNLRGTELVVLSACQTGLGDLKSGEGVSGLRWAFLYAGARTLVTSLFEVPDTETRDLMKHFYGRLKTHGKLEALHGAQLALIQQRRESHRAAHPFFWASFVLVGDPK